METFGRPLAGSPDALIGWKQEWVQITDPKVLALSGEAMHPILRYTGGAGDFVLGTAFAVSKIELFAADDYEVDDYKRVLADLKSGRKAWVYVAGDTEYPPANAPHTPQEQSPGYPFSSGALRRLSPEG